MRVVSFSDFHLFATRSRGEKILPSVIEHCAHADTLVICGDLFDFRWSNAAEHQPVFERAYAWMKELCSQVSVEVVYILGNHDGLSEFIPTLERMDATLSNFSWKEDYHLVGDTLFLHGDIPIYSEGAKISPRTYSSGEAIKHPILSICYQLITVSYLLKLWRKSTNQNRKIPYIYKALQNHPEIAAKVKHVVFGHTHNRVSHYTYRGLTFFNGGTAIKTFSIELGNFTITQKAESV